MKELINPVKDFELTTGAFLKHYCILDIKCFYDVIEGSWDNKPYKDLILYVTTPNSKDMYKANIARNTIVDELTDTDDCFMGDYANYQTYANKLREYTIIVIRKYDDDKYLY